MLTEHQRMQLIDEYRRAPRSVAGLLLTCVAGLLIVIVVALIGVDIHSFGVVQTAPQSTADAR